MTITKKLGFLFLLICSLYTLKVDAKVDAKQDDYQMCMDACSTQYYQCTGGASTSHNQCEVFNYINWTWCVDDVNSVYIGCANQADSTWLNCMSGLPVWDWQGRQNCEDGWITDIASCGREYNEASYHCDADANARGVACGVSALNAEAICGNNRVYCEGGCNVPR